MSNSQLCSAAMLYQKQEGLTLTNKVRGCLITIEDGDDEYTLKAKAERYIANHSSMGPETEGMALVGWWFSWNKPENE